MWTYILLNAYLGVKKNPSDKNCVKLMSFFVGEYNDPEIISVHYNIFLAKGYNQVQAYVRIQCCFLHVFVIESMILAFAKKTSRITHFLQSVGFYIHPTLQFRGATAHFHQIHQKVFIFVNFHDTSCLSSFSIDFTICADPFQYSNSIKKVSSTYSLETS